MNEYICNLPPCKGGPVKSSVQVGSVVLVRGEEKIRLKWPIGIVQEVYPGKDGLVWAVDVKTAKSVVTRPVQKIHDLELTDSKREPSPPPTPITEKQRSKQNFENTEFGTAESDTSICNKVNDQNSGLSDGVQDLQYVSRYGRSVKRPVKLDL